MIRSIDANNNNKIQHPVRIRTLSKIGIKGKFLKLLKDIYKNATANIILDERLTASP